MVFKPLSMGDLVPFLRLEGFEPEVSAAMGTAYERACAHIQDGQQADLVREMIASRIIELVRNGGHDADALCAETLSSLGIEVPTTEPWSGNADRPKPAGSKQG